ncbi:hypothetical protein [Paenibacillus sp. IITD108]|uniref:hypothetical protein n=1 Tax=Paenibacillus sp. IITD108 TaxID=3116649 RepID=UPI002F3E6DD9
MMQLINAISAYGRSRDRAMDLHDLKGFALNVFNSLQSSVVFDNFITRDSELNETEFILGGYSWIRKSFSIFLIQYSRHYKKFVVRPAFNLGRLGKIIFAGDWKHKGKHRLVERLRKKYGVNLAGDNVQGFDMEPLEALSDLLLEAGRDDTIGGPPQLVKVYQHMNCKPIGVLWPPGVETPERTVLGRKLFEFEDSDHWFIDIKTLRTQRIEKPQI